MYSFEERKMYFDDLVELLKTAECVEGIVQIGSGVAGYTDEYSDVDLMVATSEIEQVAVTKEFIRDSIRKFNPLYIKEKQLRKDIFLIIAFMENGLEFNVSIVPIEYLSVKSPLWKVIVDKTSLVTEKMNFENEKFLNKPDKYPIDADVPFEFVYSSLALEKELKRGNFIYALKMLEVMRELTLIVQALNEDKKFHQFKAYKTLDTLFVESYLSTFPKELTVENLRMVSEKLKEVFMHSVKKSTSFFIDSDLERLLNNSINTKKGVNSYE